MTNNATTRRQGQCEDDVKLILALIEQRGAISREEICAELGLNPNTASSRLRHMHQDLRIIRRQQERKGFATVQWVLGDDPTLPAEEEGDTKQHTVPALQVGMKADPFALPVTFFRPALAA